METKKIFKDVEKEIIKARESFPAFHSHHEAYAVIKEEVDELWDWIKGKRNTNPEKYQEAIQIMAMCVCYCKEVLDVKE